MTSTCIKEYPTDGIYGVIKNRKLRIIDTEIPNYHLTSGTICSLMDKFDIIHLMWKLNITAPDLDLTECANHNDLLNLLMVHFSDKEMELTTWDIQKLSYFYKWLFDIKHQNTHIAKLIARFNKSSHPDSFKYLVHIITDKLRETNRLYTLDQAKSKRIIRLKSTSKYIDENEPLHCPADPIVEEPIVSTNEQPNEQSNEPPNEQPNEQPNEPPNEQSKSKKSKKKKSKRHWVKHQKVWVKLQTNQPVDEQPSDEQPVETQSTDDQPIDEQPIDEQTAEEQPINEQPVEDQPIVEQSIEEPIETSVDDEPIGNQSEKQTGVNIAVNFLPEEIDDLPSYFFLWNKLVDHLPTDVRDQYIRYIAETLPTSKDRLVQNKCAYLILSMITTAYLYVHDNDIMEPQTVQIPLHNIVSKSLLLYGEMFLIKNNIAISTP
jgi:hypothetical protein